MKKILSLLLLVVTCMTAWGYTSTGTYTCDGTLGSGTGNASIVITPNGSNYDVIVTVGLTFGGTEYPITISASNLQLVDGVISTPSSRYYSDDLSLDYTSTDNAFTITLSEDKTTFTTNGKLNYYYTYTCNITDGTPILELVSGGGTSSGPHTHSYSSEWSYDETGHWHVCTNTTGTCDEPRSDFAEHTYGTSGTGVYTCTVCGWVNNALKPSKLIDGKAYAIYDTNYNLYWDLENRVTATQTTSYNNISNQATPTIVKLIKHGSDWYIQSTESGYYLRGYKWNATVDPEIPYDWTISENDDHFTIYQSHSGNSGYAGAQSGGSGVAVYCNNPSATNFDFIPYVKVTYNYTFNGTSIGTSSPVYLKEGDSYPEYEIPAGYEYSSGAPTGTVSADEAILIEKTIDIAVIVLEPDGSSFARALPLEIGRNSLANNAGEDVNDAKYYYINLTEGKYLFTPSESYSYWIYNANEQVIKNYADFTGYKIKLDVTTEGKFYVVVNYANAGQTLTIEDITPDGSFEKPYELIIGDNPLSYLGSSDTPKWYKGEDFPAGQYEFTSNNEVHGILYKSDGTTVIGNINGGYINMYEMPEYGTYYLKYTQGWDNTTLTIAPFVRDGSTKNRAIELTLDVPVDASNNTWYYVDTEKTGVVGFTFAGTRSGWSRGYVFYEGYDDKEGFYGFWYNYLPPGRYYIHVIESEEATLTATCKDPVPLAIDASITVKDGEWYVFDSDVYGDVSFTLENSIYNALVFYNENLQVVTTSFNIEADGYRRYYKSVDNKAYYLIKVSVVNHGETTLNVRVSKTVTVPNEYATFVAPFNIIELPGEVVHATQVNGSTVHFEPITSGSSENTEGETVYTGIPANTAVILKNTTGTTATFTFVGSSKNTSLGTNNDLTWSGTDIQANGNQYVITKKNGKIAFYPVKVGSTITARKGYLDLTGTASANLASLWFEDETTEIVSVEANGEYESIYNLNGQKLSVPQKGINIINGKKVIIK